MSFIWFWTFWHWSKEGFRAGSLLRSPLQGIGSHWDEWFRHEASEADRAAIAQTGGTETSQRHFIAWFLFHWTREANLSGGPPARRFALGQLAHVQPFSRWTAFEKYRASYHASGVSAIVLAENSPGESKDVRAVEAVALPADATEPAVVAEGFQADSIELETPRRAAMSLFRGKGLFYFLLLWITFGRRPYPRWLKILLSLGWLAVGALILYFLLGPEPGEHLVSLSAALVALWAGLVCVAAAMLVMQSLRAWRQGRNWCDQLERSQVRLLMRGGLTLKGGSAGLPFCLNAMLSLYRADVQSARRSWLWRRLFHKVRRDAGAWAATGVITADGYLKPVVLEAKLRACLRRGGIKHVLTPQQPGSSRSAISHLRRELTPSRRDVASLPPSQSEARLGFAAEEQILQVHPYRHVAQALMRLGEFTSSGQLILNVLAVVFSAVILFALPDLRGILLPPPAPMVVRPVSPLPDYLWVSLDTKHPESFLVVLESRFWLNRRAEVSPHSGANGSVRAEIRLQRLAAPSNNNPEDGIVWVERCHRFLGREFAPGERVGRYDLSYLNRMGHE